MSDCKQYTPHYSRRDFLTKTTMGMGAAALGSLLQPTSLFGRSADPSEGIGGPHFAPKARRVIYLFQSGGPSQMELFDYKPMLEKMNGEELPESIRKGQRLTGMTAGQKSFPLAGSQFKFAQYGKSGAWVSELMPHTARITDELCFIKSMYTEAINHDPAITFFQTGSQQPGRPCIGSWISYGLGSDNDNLPTFCVLLSEGKSGGQPLYSRLWGNGFLPSVHQGVQFRSGKDPVLYLNNPPSIDNDDRERQLSFLKRMHEMQYARLEDPEISTKIAQYEMAFRMQTSVPETMNIDDEPDYIYDMYGPEARIPGTYAANCLLARRLVERDVKFIQLYHQGWDHHGSLPSQIQKLAKSVDQPSAGLIMDLKQRGLLEDTLVVWGGEFGRTNYSQGRLTKTNYGRDHHPRCFTIWMAGAGIKKGMVYGATDDFSYNIIEKPVHVHDFQATMLHLLGVDHEKLTYKHQGRRYRLTDVHGKVVRDIIA
ncbi:hypothetical protein OKW21_005540 [Catalinimonas alkaloidigena]|uniref:DUF1501 domain-containing protein n=1 Tax=Catalinimonas alkaloidigena TaxID=1075417 RepID=UPI002405211A|nr:DUF1501 domain-containing protein [Catalinimonas alkaloidigena]MDF9800277.1 hypothetical protein [Catalinimonas alkaloidigena]